MVLATLILMGSLGQPALPVGEVRSLITKNGARATVASLAQDEAQWDRVLLQIATGKRPWLDVAAEFAPFTDGFMSETLEMAIQEALPRNPEAVLGLVASGTFSLRGACGMYGFGQIEDKRAISSLLGLVELRQQAVSKVSRPNLAEVRSGCLNELKKLREALNRGERDNKELERTRREGVPASRAVVRVSPRRSIQCCTGDEALKPRTRRWE